MLPGSMHRTGVEENADEPKPVTIIIGFWIREGHYIVVCGYDANRDEFEIRDPANSRCVWIHTREEFSDFFADDVIKGWSNVVTLLIHGWSVMWALFPSSYAVVSMHVVSESEVYRVRKDGLINVSFISNL
uniref:Uncharacterized protein n=1 Tax=Nelumbo nucifera TaxID=4432 RepID=A0A822Z5M8_NELNU|nr:TPA_asm: hypothetical protein HUJ06_013293 [Nelumbo nucifera]